MCPYMEYSPPTMAEYILEAPNDEQQNTMFQANLTVKVESSLHQPSMMERILSFLMPKREVSLENKDALEFLS